MESDGDYDATSKPVTSTQVNTAISDVETILEAIKPDATQAVKDVIIKEVMIMKLNNLRNYLRAQGRDTIEEGDPTLHVILEDLTKIQIDALNGSAGKTYPRFDVVGLR